MPKKSVGRKATNTRKKRQETEKILKKYGRLIRVSWYLFVPLLLFLLLIPSPFEHSPLSAPIEGQVEITENVKFQPAKNILQELFRFTNLEWHTICFVDNGGKIINGGTETPFDFKWSVYFNNQSTLVIPFNSSNCTTAKAGTSFTYQWSGNPTVKASLNELRGGVSLVPNTDSYSATDPISYIVMLWIFLLAWFEFTKLTSNYIKHTFASK